MFQIQVLKSTTGLKIDDCVKVFFRGEDISEYIDTDSVEMETTFYDNGGKQTWASLPVPVEIIEEEPPLTEEEYEALIDLDIFPVGCETCHHYFPYEDNICGGCRVPFSNWEAENAI
jgi:hypothetical protein